MLARNLNIVEVENNEIAIEAKLQRMAALKYQLEALQNEYDILKKEVIDMHFVNNELFVNQDGVCLATYKTSIRQQFNTTQFKKDHAKLYDDYSDLKEIKTFSLK